MSSPEMITRQGGPEACGRSDGIEMAVRLPGKIDAMRRGTSDSTEGRSAVKSAAGGDVLLRMPQLLRVLWLVWTWQARAVLASRALTRQTSAMPLLLQGV